MAWIDTKVVREGKWVSENKTETIPGEPCIDITDGPGYYTYNLSYIPLDNNTNCTIVDTDGSREREKQFNAALENQGLPPYFNITKGE